MTLKQLQKEAHKIRMTPEEKAAMRARIFGAPSPTASPYFFFNVQFMTRALAGVLVVVLIGGTGIAYAAQGSLPGDTLYPIKVDITEPLQVALAPTPSARAQVNVELAQLRVEEAESLSQKGELTATTTAQLDQNFESHVQSADNLAVEVGATDPSAAVEIKAQLASALSVHGAILAALGTESNSNDTKSNAERFASRVIARAEAADFAQSEAQATGSEVALLSSSSASRVPAAASMRDIRAFAPMTPTSSATTSGTSTVNASSTESSTTSGSSTEERANAQGGHRGMNELQVRAQDALAQAQSSYDATKANLDATTSAAYDAQFSQAQSDLQNGDYAAALELALRLQVILSVQSHYRDNIITPLLQLKLNVNESRHQGDGGSHGWVGLGD